MDWSIDAQGSFGKSYDVLSKSSRDGTEQGASGSPVKPTTCSPSALSDGSKMLEFSSPSEFALDEAFAHNLQQGTEEEGPASRKLGPRVFRTPTPHFGFEVLVE